MTSEKNNFYESFVHMFKKKTDPQKMMLELRSQVGALDEQVYGLDYDLKKLRKERERVIQKGTQAAKGGDQALMQESGHDLRSMNAELAYVQQSRSGLVKSRMLCNLSLRRLSSSLSGGAMDTMKKVLDVLQDNELSAMLDNRECSEAQFMEVLDRKMDSTMRGLENRVNMLDQEVSAEVNLFAELARAEESGDTGKVAEIMSRMTGEQSKGKDEVDTLLS